MRRYKFTFKFKGGEISVWAFNKQEAEILAKAEAINRAWDCAILDYTKCN